MSKRGKGSTGGNTEPLAFVRKFGPNADELEQKPFLQPAITEEDTKPAGPTEFSVAPPPVKDEPKEGKSPQKRERKRSRSRSRDKKKRRHRSRSSSASRHRRRSRSRSRDRDRKSRRRSRSYSRERRDRRSRDRDEPHTKPLPLSAQTDNPVAQVANILPPQLRGSVVAQSLLAKPDALPSLLGDAVGELTEAGGQLALALPDDILKQQERERKRKSRWSTAKSFVPGMPTMLPKNLDENQQKCYLLQLEIEEATRKLRVGDFIAPEHERSPSPPPQYDSNGKRTNTRDVRKRKELETLRGEKIQQLLRLNPSYKPPADYRCTNTRPCEKVYIPQDDHPEINFVGLLIGPRGNTLKALENETEAKIIIRGKGSVKEGKLGRREGPLPGENEPLHAFVSGTSQEIVATAVNKIKEIINAALMIPDGQNELRKLQLRELAVLNGTLRPEDMLGGTRCSNCGSDQHKTWECMDGPNVTASIICQACGAAGHIARDCKNPNPGYQYGEIAGMDDEYSALMAELGEKPANAGPGQQQQVQQPREKIYTLPSGAPIQRFARKQDPNPGGGPNGFGAGFGGGEFFNANTYDRQVAQAVAQNAANWVPPPPAPPPPSMAWAGRPPPYHHPHHPPPPHAFPMPVPPPPCALQDNPFDYMVPPPPPPPPPPADDFSQLLAAPPAPPPPPM